MPHLESTILTPSKFKPEDAYFPCPANIRPGEGKAFVAMFPEETEVGDTFEFQGRTVRLERPKEVADKYRPDVGVVIHPGDSPYLYVGQIVGVKPYTGVWMTNRDLPFIPEGREMRILGTVDDVLDNIVVEFVEEAA